MVGVLGLPADGLPLLLSALALLLLPLLQQVLQGQVSESLFELFSWTAF